MKKAILTAAVSLLAFRLIAKTKKKSMKAFSPIKPNQRFRACDGKGCGHFGAPRRRKLADGSIKKYKHQGVDILTFKGEPIRSPITGVLKRYAYPYGEDSIYKGLVVENDSYFIKLFYLVPTLAKGAILVEGMTIGRSQDVAELHGSSMGTHVHFEAYKKVGGKLVLIDPTQLFKPF